MAEHDQASSIREKFEHVIYFFEQQLTSADFSDIHAISEFHILSQEASQIQAVLMERLEANRPHLAQSIREDLSLAKDFPGV